MMVATIPTNGQIAFEMYDGADRRVFAILYTDGNVAALANIVARAGKKVKGINIHQFAAQAVSLAYTQMMGEVELHGAASAQAGGIYPYEFVFYEGAGALDLCVRAYVYGQMVFDGSAGDMLAAAYGK